MNCRKWYLVGVWSVFIFYSSLIGMARFFPVQKTLSKKNFQDLKNALPDTEGAVESLVSDIAEMQSRYEQFWYTLRSHFSEKNFEPLKNQAQGLGDALVFLAALQPEIKKYKKFFPEDIDDQLALYKKRIKVALTVFNDFTSKNWTVSDEMPIKEQMNKLNRLSLAAKLLQTIPTNPLQKMGEDDVVALLSALRFYKRFTDDTLVNMPLIKLAESLIKESDVYKRWKKSGVVKSGKITIDGKKESIW